MEGNLEGIIQLDAKLKRCLWDLGVETLFGPGQISYPASLVLEPPVSLKWLRIEYGATMGAFSYAVSGYCMAAEIGRYCSFGEDVQIGRQDHPLDWITTSPIAYLSSKIFDVGVEFASSADYHRFTSPLAGVARSTVWPPKKTVIGHDVYIGHGAFIRPGVTIGTGAVVAAQAVVVKDVPAYAIVAGNPAVVKRYRFPENLIEKILSTEWWLSAPWQLDGLDLNDPTAFVAEFEARRGSIKRYHPSKVEFGKISTI